MFLTQFVRKDNKPNEDYYYHTEEEAINHLLLFTNDRSNLFKSIVASDENKNIVLQILVFDDQGKAVSFKNGDVVRLHPSFSSPAERHLIYAITNINDHTMRCTISCLNSKMTIPPSELVGINMITPVETTLEEIIETASKKSPSNAKDIKLSPQYKKTFDR